MHKTLKIRELQPNEIMEASIQEVDIPDEILRTMAQQMRNSGRDIILIGGTSCKIRVFEVMKKTTG